MKVYLIIFLALFLILVTPSLAETTPPTWSTNKTNSTHSGILTKHSVVLSDNIALDYYIFEFDNGTSSLSNISTVDISGTSITANQTIIINSTVGATIRWRYYFNDTSNNWNRTDLFSYATTQSPTQVCTIRSSCNAGEVCLFSLFQSENSHAGDCNAYGNKVCCTEVSSNIRSSCNSNEGAILSLFQLNDSHVGNPNYYSNIVCVNYSSNPAVTNLRDACLANETCAVSLFQANNSHAAQCGYYDSKLCIKKLFNITITVNLNNTSPTWNEGLRISGRATRADGTSVDTSANGVKVYINGTLRCTNETDSSGDYTCDFNAPNSTGKYEANVTVDDPLMGRTFYNSTSFTVKPVFGATEETAATISCYEEPRVIQNPDGTIKVAIVRICVWK